MKKLILILSIMVIGLISFGQSTPTQVTPDSYLSEPTYQYVFGTSADTLTDADTLSFVWRVQGMKTYDINIKLYNDFVSGSAGGKLKTYKSIDGVNYEVTAAADSITVATLTADALDSEVISLSDFLYPYLKVEYIQSGTAVTIPKVYIYAKEN